MIRNLCLIGHLSQTPHHGSSMFNYFMSYFLFSSLDNKMVHKDLCMSLTVRTDILLRLHYRELSG